MKTFRTLATVGIIGAVAAYAGTAHAEQRSTSAIQIQLASTMNYNSAPGGYKWERTAAETVAPTIVASASSAVAAGAGYKWASAGEPAMVGSTLIAERADREYARSGVAGESGYKWGIRSISDQAGYKWGIRSVSDQAGYKWGIR
jgi:hypothetical protein